MIIFFSPPYYTTNKIKEKQNKNTIHFSSYFEIINKS